MSGWEGRKKPSGTGGAEEKARGTRQRSSRSVQSVLSPKLSDCLQCVWVNYSNEGREEDKEKLATNSAASSSHTLRKLATSYLSRQRLWGSTWSSRRRASGALSLVTGLQFLWPDGFLNFIPPLVTNLGGGYTQLRG